MTSVDFYVSETFVPYDEAIAWMQVRIQDIAEGRSPEAVWFLEHPPLYTKGTSAQAQDLLRPLQHPLYDAGRGGRYTYHGPGQLVIYTLINLGLRGRDVRHYVYTLEKWMLDVLLSLGFEGYIHPNFPGAWVGKYKIGFVGVRLRKWVSFHGLSFNVSPCLENFKAISPCGLESGVVTSLKEQGLSISLQKVRECFLTTSPWRTQEDSLLEVKGATRRHPLFP